MKKKSIIILAENLKYIFKYKIFHYYEELNKQIEKDEEKVKVEINNYLGDQSFIYFKNAYHSLVEIRKVKNKIKNKNLKKLFCIAFCNFYLEKFVYYISEQKNLVSACRNEIFLRR